MTALDLRSGLEDGAPIPHGPAEAAKPAGPAPWQLSSTALAWIVAGVVLLLVGMLARRSEVAVLGAPLLVGAVWAWLRRPAGIAQVDLAAAEMAEPGEVSARLELTPAPGMEALQLKVRAPGHRSREALVDLRRSRDLGVAMWTVRTGRREMFGVDHIGSASDGLTRFGPATSPPIMVTVLPRTLPLRELPLPFRLQGLTGPHTSRRPGDGDDLHDINLFTPGDRLRRIDWRATARRSAASGTGKIIDLYVRRTFATADATVMLVLDSRDDIGPDVSVWGDSEAIRQDEATSLDLAREAAASLARRYLDGGDRVGLEDLGRLRRPVPPAGGRHQLRRLIHRLALSQPEGEPKPRERAPRLPSGALIIVFSTFLDDDAARLAQLWRHAGHRVVAVDILPRLITRNLGGRASTAYRLLRLERNERLRDLGRSGIELAHWESDSPDRSRASSTPPALVELAALARIRRRRR